MIVHPPTGKTTMKHWTKKSKLSIKLPTQHSTVQQGYGRVEKADQLRGYYYYIWIKFYAFYQSDLLLSHIYKCSSTHFISLPFWIIISQCLFSSLSSFLILLLSPQLLRSEFLECEEEVTWLVLGAGGEGRHTVSPVGIHPALPYWVAVTTP